MKNVSRLAKRLLWGKPSLNKDQKADIADNVMSGRKSGADMARLYKVSPATITRTVAEARLKQEDISA